MEQSYAFPPGCAIVIVRIDEWIEYDYYSTEMKCTVLGSGSKANAYLFESDGVLFAIDNGYSLREFARRTAMTGNDYRNLSFILVTHGHQDHIKGVARLSRAARASVYMPESIAADMAWEGDFFERRVFEAGDTRTVNGVEIRSFALNHDSPGAQSYRIGGNGGYITLITDTGAVTPEMHSMAVESEILLLEANYCPDLLHGGPYPYFLKKRIASDSGHLSNRDAASFVNSLRASRSLRKVFFCHLSEVNNSPEVLSRSVKDALEWPVAWQICPRDEFTQVV